VGEECSCFQEPAEHLGWQHTHQLLGHCGLLGKLGNQMDSTSVHPPKCTACQLGKQERTPKDGSTCVKGPDGVLKMNQLAPGNLVFSDQYNSPLLGRQFLAQGNTLTTQTFHGGAIFCDAASAKLTLVHQVGLTGTKTVQAKLRFEREATAVGFWVHAYCTDNDVYTSKEFTTKLASKGHWCPSPQWCDGKCIKGTIQSGRTIMIYTALHYSGHLNLGYPTLVGYQPHDLRRSPLQWSPQFGISNTSWISTMH
jgi:hypothetical protein